jgi:hypothetical protein
LDGDPESATITGVEGAVTDLIVPSVGDFVRHHDRDGRPFLARVIRRFYSYSIADGEDVDGSVTVTLELEKMMFH